MRRRWHRPRRHRSGGAGGRGGTGGGESPVVADAAVLRRRRAARRRAGGRRRRPRAGRTDASVARVPRNRAQIVTTTALAFGTVAILVGTLVSLSTARDVSPSAAVVVQRSADGQVSTPRAPARRRGAHVERVTPGSPRAIAPGTNGRAPRAARRAPPIRPGPCAAGRRGRVRADPRARGCSSGLRPSGARARGVGARCCSSATPSGCRARPSPDADRH